jgi:hypothetical protein
MSFFDDVRAKVDEFLGGGIGEVANQIQDSGSQHIEDATQSVEDVVAQAEEILPGKENNQE